MKKLKQARAKTQRLFLIGFAMIIAFLCFASSPTAKAGCKTTGATTAIFFGGIGFTKFEKDDAGAGGGTPEEKEAKLLKKMKDGVTAQFKELMESSNEFKNIGSLIEKVDKASTKEDLIKLTGEMEKLGLKVKEMAEQGGQGVKAKYKTYADVLVDLMKKEFKDGSFKSLLAKKSGMIVMQHKAADNPMSETTSIVPMGSAIPFALTEYEQGVTRVVRRKPFILSLVNVSRTIAEYLAWAEQTNVAPGVAGNTAEGALKTVGSFRWTEQSQKIETMTYFSKLTKRILDDIAVMENEVRTEIMELLALKLDAQVLGGDGNSPNLKGILSYAIQTSAGIGAGTPLFQKIQTPSMFDAVYAAATQIKTKGTSPGAGAEIINIFDPNYVVINPADAAIMEMQKDSEGRYLLPPFVSADGMRVAGLQVVENIGVTAGSFLVGDFTKSTVRIREDASIAIGFENDDFTKNLVTILGEMRAGHYIKTNYLNAFYADTFDNTITAITKP